MQVTRLCMAIDFFFFCSSLLFAILPTDFTQGFSFLQECLVRWFELLKSYWQCCQAFRSPLFKVLKEELLFWGQDSFGGHCWALKDGCL